MVFFFFCIPIYFPVDTFIFTENCIFSDNSHAWFSLAASGKTTILVGKSDKTVPPRLAPQQHTFLCVSNNSDTHLNQNSTVFDICPISGNAMFSGEED